jgi:hypothetical protein
MHSGEAPSLRADDVAGVGATIVALGHGAGAAIVTMAVIDAVYVAVVVNNSRVVRRSGPRDCRFVRQDAL